MRLLGKEGTTRFLSTALWRDEFTPRFGSELDVSWLPPDDPSGRADADELASRLTDGSTFHQVAWMGRSCFRPYGDDGFLGLKGVGPSPGSEWMRKLIDGNLRRSYDGDGGCLRLPTSTCFPLLVPFGRDGIGWRAHASRPEGMSRFELCILEAEAALMYRAAGVPAMTPVTVFRTPVAPAWRGGEPGLKAFLDNALPRAIPEHLQRARGEGPFTLRLDPQPYPDLAPGLIARRMRSPYRIANLQQAVVDGDADGVGELASHMGTVLRCADDQIGSSFVKRLASTAGTLFAEGIVHGQLHIHHQDVTLAGELADLDCTLFLRSLPHFIDDVPFGPSRPGINYSAHRARLQRLEDRHHIRLLDDMDRRCEAQVIGTGATESWRRLRVAVLLLRQVYDLWNQACLTADRLRRSGPARPGATGSVLSSAERAGLRDMFAREFMDRLRSRHALGLLHWCGRYGWDYLDAEICAEGRRTLYGWWAPDVPTGFVDVPTDARRAAATRDDLMALFQAIGSAE